MHAVRDLLSKHDTLFDCTYTWKTYLVLACAVGVIVRSPHRRDMNALARETFGR